MRLTERNTAGLKLETGKSDWIWWDDDITGFGIRVRAGGSRNWIYRYRIGSKQRSLILGSAKSLPLSLARQNASKLEARVRLPNLRLTILSAFWRISTLKHESQNGGLSPTRRLSAI
jgi:hypothetical protein